MVREFGSLVIVSSISRLDLVERGGAQDIRTTNAVERENYPRRLNKGFSLELPVAVPYLYNPDESRRSQETNRFDQMRVII